MHDDETPIDEALVRRLLASQHPEYSSLPMARARETGTDNAMFRLGDDLAVRLPRIPAAALQAAKEREWLPRIAPHLPVPAPVPVAFGEPEGGYPYVWSVVRWLPGETVDVAPDAATRELAAFVRALRAVDATGAPGPGEHNFGRGRPLAARDVRVRDAVGKCEGLLDTRAVERVWDECLAAPVWDGPPVWIHGDLHRGNVLVDGGHVSGVIDWGGLAAGDPATDVMVAWTYLPPSARESFQEAVGVDDATWTRARGWALSMGILALPYYLERSPAIAALSRRWVELALAD